MAENETPKLDYWMIGILEECAKTEIKRLSSWFNPAYVKRHLEGRNEYDNFGQIQLILDRLNEMRTHYDNEIKDGLDKTNASSPVGVRVNDPKD